MVPQSGRLNLYLCLKCVHKSFSLFLSLKLVFCFRDRWGCGCGSLLQVHPHLLRIIGNQRQIFCPVRQFFVWSWCSPLLTYPASSSISPPSLRGGLFCWWIIVLDPFSWILFLVIVVQIETDNLIINDFATYVDLRIYIQLNLTLRWIMWKARASKLCLLWQNKGLGFFFFFLNHSWSSFIW